MINPNYVDGLELKIKELAAERDAALAQNVELVAQVGRMQSFIRMAAEKWKDCQELEPTFLNLLRVANDQPEEALRQIQADAGRKGYLQGIYDWRMAEVNYKDFDITFSATEYADKVRKGW